MVTGRFFSLLWALGCLVHHQWFPDISYLSCKPSVGDIFLFLTGSDVRVCIYKNAKRDVTVLCTLMPASHEMWPRFSFSSVFVCYWVLSHSGVIFELKKLKEKLMNAELRWYFPNETVPITFQREREQQWRVKSYEKKTICFSSIHFHESRLFPGTETGYMVEGKWLSHLFS